MQRERERWNAHNFSCSTRITCVPAALSTARRVSHSASPNVNKPSTCGGCAESTHEWIPASLAAFVRWQEGQPKTMLIDNKELKHNLLTCAVVGHCRGSRPATVSAATGSTCIGDDTAVAPDQPAGRTRLTNARSPKPETLVLFPTITGLASSSSELDSSLLLLLFFDEPSIGNAAGKLFRGFPFFVSFSVSLSSQKSNPTLFATALCHSCCPNPKPLCSLHVLLRCARGSLWLGVPILHM
jgi:hypothetical protein